MEHPDYLSSAQMSALLLMSRALNADGIEKIRARDSRAVVQLHALPVSLDEPDRHEFRIVTVRGEFGDRDHHQSIHGTVAFQVLDDGYNDALLVSLNISSPLNQ